MGTSVVQCVHGKNTLYYHQGFGLMKAKKKNSSTGKEQIDQIVNAIVAGYSPDKIILFGSHAQGSATMGSDVDLLVIEDDSLPKIRRNRVVRSFLKDFSTPVDIIVKTSQEFEMFKDIIGTVVYSANKYGRLLYG
jgi:uncharacterized protein